MATAVTVVYHYDDGTTRNVSVAPTTTSYKILTTPSKFVVGNVSAKFQLFNEYGVNATSQYSGSSFTVNRFYTSQWRSDTGLYLTGGNYYNVHSYALGNILNLFPQVDSYTLSGTFNYGPYENKNITITGKANYAGGTDVSVKSSLSRQYLCSNWYDCNGTSISVTPGATTVITLPSSYTYPTTLLIKGRHSSTTAWTTYSSSKAISALPALAARPNSHTYHNVNLQYQEKSGLRKETLSVDTEHVYTFSHWANDAAGTTATDTSYKPTADTTVYAVWTESTGVRTTLPTWTTADYAPDPTSFDVDTEVYFYDPRYDAEPEADSTQTIYSARNYPLKHIGWTLNGGSYIYNNGTSVSGAANDTYTAQFQLDKSKSYYETYSPEDFIEHPAPEPYAGHEYLGLSWIRPSEPEQTIAYAPGEVIPVSDCIHSTGHTELHRVWKRTIPVGLVRIYNSTTKKMEKYKPVIYNSSTKQWESYLPKIYNGTDWNDIYS